MEGVLDKNIRELRDILDKREVSSVELTAFYLDRIKRFDDEIGAYIRVTEGLAMEMAQEADKKIAQGEKGRLLGIPLGIKDTFCTKGVETTCASSMLKGFISPYDGTIIKRLKEEGYVHLGRLNMDEFAMGSSTENSCFHVTKNPWDRTRIPGGSSGGSAAATTGGLCAASIGSDTGGSIRQPAGFCGVVGLKPTYGRISRYGLIALASSLDQAGPITRDVTDCAIMLGATSGYDPMDSTSIPGPVPDYEDFLRKDIKGLRIGIPREYSIEGMEQDVKRCVDEALALFEKNGAIVVDISLPHTEYAVSAYCVISMAEASSNLARYDGVRYGLRVDGKDITDMYKKSRHEGLGKEVKRRIILGTYVLSSGYYDAYYRKAGQARTLIWRDFNDAFRECDIIVTAASPTTAFKIGEKIDNPLAMYLSDIFTIPASLANLPAMSIPCGFDGAGLPVGLQIVGQPLDEGRMLQAAYVLESEIKVKKIPDKYNGGR